MRDLRGFAAYALMLLLFALGIYGLLSYGEARFGSGTAQPSPALAHPVAHGGLQDPLSVLMLQIIVVLVVARSMGALFLRLRQPRVIGEILAGILLGPSLLGMVWPSAQAFLFPPDSVGALRLLSQLGMLLFMFVVGMDLDTRQLRARGQSVLIISHASIVVPFLLGVMLALPLFRPFAPAGVGFTSFGLFLGIALSITAFPVLARILSDRGLTDSPLGRTVITCAAVDDVTAWCLLALVIAIIQASGVGGAIATIALAVSFIVFMLAWLRPRMERFVAARYADGVGNGGLISGMLVLTFASAAFAAAIGINALFGAFLAGVVIPAQTRFRAYLKERVETFGLFLMPLFFAFTGLRTEIGLLDDWQDWVICAAIILVAIAGKLLGAMFASRWAGMPWRDSFVIGALMNTRGLMELVVLNIGYDLGILSPRIFSMLVIMTLVTTFMTGPLISLAGRGVLARTSVRTAPG